MNALLPFPFPFPKFPSLGPFFIERPTNHKQDRQTYFFALLDVDLDPMTSILKLNSYSEDEDYLHT